MPHIVLHPTELKLPPLQTEVKKSQLGPPQIGQIILTKQSVYPLAQKQQFIGDRIVLFSVQAQQDGTKCSSGGKCREVL